MKSKTDADKIIGILEKTYPDAKPQLEFNSTYELLVAVILSAQCTDKRVNIVTRELFKNYNEPQKMIELVQKDLEKIIKPCGLYRSKATHILTASRKIVDGFGGQVPDTYEGLLSLDGVGRKTANVVLSVGFSRDAIAVDTHVFRVARRLGLSDATTPTGVEKHLNSLIDKDKWSASHHYLIYHGRNVCKAIGPKCFECALSAYCEKNGLNQK